MFKGRTSDLKDKDTAIERCDVELRDTADEAECRLVVKMICRHGKFYLLPRVLLLLLS